MDFLYFKPLFRLLTHYTYLCYNACRIYDPKRKEVTKMPKIALVLLVILGTVVVHAIVDKSLGIDLSEVSFSKKIVHDVIYILTGAAIFAVIWFV